MCQGRVHSRLARPMLGVDALRQTAQTLLYFAHPSSSQAWAGPPRRIPRPDYLSSFFRAAAAGDGLESLVLLAILPRVGKPKIDIAIQACVWVILGCIVGCCTEGIASRRYSVRDHSPGSIITS